MHSLYFIELSLILPYSAILPKQRQSQPLEMRYERPQTVDETATVDDLGQ